MREGEEVKQNPDKNYFETSSLIRVEVKTNISPAIVLENMTLQWYRKYMMRRRLRYTEKKAIST